ncbi:MAG: FAD-dependent oxidoreductase [Bacillota bacterium]
MKRLHADVAVIGAGIIGTAIAYQLALAGRRVVVLEGRYPAAGASGACNGGLNYIGKHPALFGPAVDSLHRYRTLAAELQAKLDCCQGLPVIYACRGPTELAAVEPLVQLCRDWGLDAHLVSGAAVRELEPLLSPQVTGAAVADGGLQGVVDPFAVTRAFLRAALALGAAFHRGEALALSTAGGKVAGVAGDSWEVSCPCVVVANGAQAPELVPELPVAPCKGIVLVTERTKLKVNGCILSAAYLAAEHAGSDPGHTALGLAVEQAASGNILIGSSRAMGDGGRAVTPGIPEALAANAVTYMPALAKLQVIRIFTGVRARTPDNLPLIGPVGPDGLYAAAGFEGVGITLAPWAGAYLAGVVSGSLRPDPALAADRFTGR